MSFIHLNETYYQLLSIQEAIRFIAGKETQKIRE